MSSVLSKAHQPELSFVAVPVLVWVGLGELCHICDGAELQHCCWEPGSCCGEEVSDKELSTGVLCGPRILRQGPACVVLPVCMCVLFISGRGRRCSRETRLLGFDAPVRAIPSSNSCSYDSEPDHALKLPSAFQCPPRLLLGYPGAVYMLFLNTN